MSERIQASVNRARAMRQAREKKALAHWAKVGALIYFVQAGEYLKVGISTRDALKGRMNSFQVSNPHPIRLLKVLHTRNPRQDERLFHELLKDYHIKGEWFLVVNRAIREFLGMN